MNFSLSVFASLQVRVADTRCRGARSVVRVNQYRAQCQATYCDFRQSMVEHPIERRLPEAHQKPPLYSPMRPPAPLSPYNRNHQHPQGSNSLKASSSLRYGTPTSPSSPQLGSATTAGSSPDRLNRANSSWSHQDTVHSAESAPAPPPAAGATASSVSNGRLDSQVAGYHAQQQPEARSSVVSRSRSGRKRVAGSAAGLSVGSAAGSAASAWVQSHSAHQLAANVKALAAEVCCCYQCFECVLPVVLPAAMSQSNCASCCMLVQRLWYIYHLLALLPMYCLLSIYCLSQHRSQMLPHTERILGAFLPCHEIALPPLPLSNSRLCLLPFPHLVILVKLKIV